MSDSKDKTVKKLIDEYLTLLDETAIYLDGYAEAIVGIQAKGGASIVYDEEKILEIIQKDQRVTREDAVAFYEYNVEGTCLGRHTPLFITTVEQLKTLLGERG